MEALEKTMAAKQTKHRSAVHGVALNKQSSRHLSGRARAKGVVKRGAFITSGFGAPSVSSYFSTSRYSRVNSGSVDLRFGGLYGQFYRGGDEIVFAATGLLQPLGIPVPGYLVQTDDSTNILVDTEFPQSFVDHPPGPQPPLNLQLEIRPGRPGASNLSV